MNKLHFFRELFEGKVLFMNELRLHERLYTLCTHMLNISAGYRLIKVLIQYVRLFNRNDS